MVFIDLSMTIAVHSCPNLDNVNKNISKEARTRCEVNTVVVANGLSKSAYCISLPLPSVEQRLISTSR